MLVVAVGGALGAIARHAGTEWVRRVAGDLFPWGTLAVNVVGSFALGFAMAWLHAHAPSTYVRQFIGIGFLASFTTFSTFSYESVAMARNGEVWRAGAYVGGSVALGIAGVLLGAALALAIVKAQS